MWLLIDSDLPLETLKAWSGPGLDSFTLQITVSLEED